MNIFRRILLFVGSWILAYFALIVIGVIVVLVFSASQIPRDSSDFYPFLYRVALASGIRYLAIGLPVSFFIGVLAAFRVRPLPVAIALPIAVLGYFILQPTGQLDGIRLSSLPFSSQIAQITQSVVKPTRIGRQVALRIPISVPVAYGHVVLPPGTLVTILAENQSGAEVRASNGSRFTILSTQIAE